jgi:hypothetical protein
MTGKHFFKYFRMSVSKFVNLKQLLHTVIEKKNTRWRWSIRTEERLGTVGLLTGHTTLRACMFKLRLAQQQDCQLYRDKKRR